ncbi:MAG: hypothetical protein ABEH80_03725 [Halobaculum sp.]
MAIQVTDLEAQAEAGISISPGTQKADALRVLVQNPQLAFTPNEVAARAEFPDANAPTVCSRLVDMGVAVNENEYYYLTRDEEVAAAARRALISHHQQDAAQKTATADEAALGGEDSAASSERLTDSEVDTELTDVNDEIADL